MPLQGPELEREPNDDLGASGELLVGDEASGYLGWNDDLDVWKLPLETLGAADAVDVHVGGVAGLALTVDVLDAEGHVLATRRGGKGDGVELPALVLAAGQGPPFAYVRVRADRSQPDVTYVVWTKARALAVDDEREPNDDLARAQPVELGQVTKATLVAGDTDRFALTPATTAPVRSRRPPTAPPRSSSRSRSAPPCSAAAPATAPSRSTSTLARAVMTVTRAAARGAAEPIAYELRVEPAAAVDPLPPELPGAP
ncbi:MAG: hypothetical protein R2939_13240 [Kofleriaceae bacterium]